LPVLIGIDVTNSSRERPSVPSQQNYLATQMASEFLNARQHAIGSEHASRLVSVNAADN
jgi:hypothetical protein